MAVLDVSVDWLSTTQIQVTYQSGPTAALLPTYQVGIQNNRTNIVYQTVLQDAIHIQETPVNSIFNLQDFLNGSDTFYSTVQSGDPCTLVITATNGTQITLLPSPVFNATPFGGTVPCFPKGTRILTQSGYKAVETLTQGELVQTADGRQVPAKIYGKHIERTTPLSAPFRVPKGSLGPSQPSHDLLLSPDHAFQLRKGVWMLPKKAALLSDRVEQVAVGEPVTYYHIECPQYLRDNLVVDGVVVESYAGKQLAKSPYSWCPSTGLGARIVSNTQAHIRKA